MLNLCSAACLQAVQRQILAAASALPEASAQNKKHKFDKFKFAYLTDSDLDFRGDFLILCSFY